MYRPMKMDYQLMMRPGKRLTRDKEQILKAFKTEINSMDLDQTNTQQLRI